VLFVVALNVIRLSLVTETDESAALTVNVESLSPPDIVMVTGEFGAMAFLSADTLNGFWSHGMTMTGQP
jgi:hypothetical protein